MLGIFELRKLKGICYILFLKQRISDFSLKKLQTMPISSECLCYNFLLLKYDQCIQKCLHLFPT